MTRLWLIRHGQTDWNVAGRWQGQSPDAPSLNAAGRAQAEALAAQLAGRGFDALYSSDLPRAWDTARAIAARNGQAIRPEPRLREVNLGAWEGLLADEIARRYPQELAERERDPVRARAPGGETVAEVAVRVWAAADDIARRHPEGDVLIVSHGLALATLLSCAQGRRLDEAHRLIPDNAQPIMVNWSPP